MTYLSAESRSAAVLLSLVSSIGAAHAIEIDTGNPDFNVRWDNTVKYNYAHRVEGQDRHILASPNNDDGDRNFDKGTVSNRIDLFSELDFIYKNKAGFRVSGAAWYDDAYRRLDNKSVTTSNHIDGGVPASGLSNTTERFHQGPSGEILDAFVFGRFDLGDMPVNLKLGRHSVFWGEALLSPIHGVGYGQAPLDLRKALSVPGTEAKELLLPRNAISAQIQVNPELSFAAQYFLDWKPFRLPEAGSYLGSFDMLVDGGESLIAGPGTRFLRGEDVEPKEVGDWGLSARWRPEWLDASLGFYYRKTSDIQPQLHITPAVATVPAANCGALGFAPLAPSTCYINPSAASVPQLLNGNIGQYHLVYPGDVDVFGFSLSKNIGGISVGTDLSYRVNMPLASDAVLILPEALTAVTPGAISALPSDGNTGGAVGNTLHGVVNLLGIVGRTPLFDQADWIAELQWNRWTSVKDGEAVFKGRSGYEGIDKVSKDFFGLAVTFKPTWFQVFPGVDLQMPIAYSTGLSGNSAVSAGGNEHAGSYSIGVGADVYQKYKFDLSYVDFFGSYRTNDAGEITSSRGSNALMGDRGFLSFTFKTSF